MSRDRLFSAISDVKGQISSMKRELTRERDAANDQLVKRLKLESKTVFRRKGNERQYVYKRGGGGKGGGSCK